MRRPSCLGIARVSVAAFAATMGTVPLLGQEQASSPTAIATEVDSLALAFMRERGLPGLAVGVIRHGRPVAARGFGVLRLGSDSKVTPETIFHLASVTKPFVATAVMQLVEEGRVDLDAPVTRYVPYFRIRGQGAADITVRQVLNHTAGLPDVTDYAWDRPEYDAGALERWIRGLADSSLIAPPGERMQYSNIGFELLAELVAKVSGEEFEAYVQRRILTPLRMRHSTVLMTDVDSARLALGHVGSGPGAVQVSPVYPYNRRHAGSSTLHSDVHDMLRWALANLRRGELDGQRILQVSSYDQLWTPTRDLTAQYRERTRRAGIEMLYESFGIGLSWFVIRFQGRRLINHSGGDRGFRSDLLLAPDDSAAVVVLANHQGADVGVLARQLLALALRPGSEKSETGEGGERQDPIAIVGVSVVDVARGRVDPDQTVVVDGDRIVRVGRRGQVAVPAGARTIEGGGRYLIPGLWDMHVHAVNPGLQELFLPLLVANGVTGIREMWSRTEWLDSARAQIKRGTLVGPRVVGAGNLVDGTPQIWPGSLGAPTPEDGKRLVDSLHRAGAGFIKVYSRLRPDTYRAIAAEAKRLGIPFAGHIPTLVSPNEASDLGQLTVEHLTMIPQACSREEDAWRTAVTGVVNAKGWDSAGVVQRQMARRVTEGYNEGRCRTLAQRFTKNGTWMVPTTTVLRSTAYLDDTTLAADPRLRFIPGFFKVSWDPRRDFRFRMLTPDDWATRKVAFRKQLEIIGLFHREGVRFLAGTDLSNPYIYPGFSLHDELATLVATGMTPLDALRAATLNPAKFLGQEREAGTIEAGKRADLVLLDANPLDDIRNTTRIRAVVAAGRLFDEQALTGLLTAGETMAARMGRGGP